MQTATISSIAAMPEATAPEPAYKPPFPPLALVTKPNLTTAEAAYYLNRKTQSLRSWACRSGTGPMVPKRIHGILAWSTVEVKRLVGIV